MIDELISGAASVFHKVINKKPIVNKKEVSEYAKLKHLDDQQRRMMYLRIPPVTQKSMAEGLVVTRGKHGQETRSLMRVAWDSSEEDEIADLGSESSS